MIKVGITGLIASGKTTVAKIIAGNKYPIFNADYEVSKIYKTNYFRKIVKKKLGLNNSTNLKKKIKKVITKKKANLKTLEKIIHPIVRKNLKKFIEKNKKQKILIFEIPLLIESKLMKNFDKIIFVNSQKKNRLKRYLKRGKSKEIFNFLDKRQLPSAKKIKFSDYVINNDKTLKFLKKNIKDIISSL